MNSGHYMQMRGRLFRVQTSCVNPPDQPPTVGRISEAQSDIPPRRRPPLSGYAYDEPLFEADGKISAHR